MRSTGWYYLVRSFSFPPAAVIGGILWTIAPQILFVTTGVFGMIGTMVFALTDDEQYAI